MSVPDCSITGVKPIIEPIPQKDIEEEAKRRAKKVYYKEWRRCCICGSIPTKMANYHMQGAVRIERYCDSCLEKQFSSRIT